MGNDTKVCSRMENVKYPVFFLVQRENIISRRRMSLARDLLDILFAGMTQGIIPFQIMH